MAKEIKRCCECSYCAMNEDGILHCDWTGFEVEIDDKACGKFFTMENMDEEA